MEYLLLLFALLLCAAVLSLRVPEPLEAEGESQSHGYADHVVLSSDLDSQAEPVDYAAGLYESIQARRLGGVSALVAMPKPIQTPQVGCVVMRQRLTCYRPDGSIGSVQDTEVVQLVKRA
jgi:hypothetical protein